MNYNITALSVLIWTGIPKPASPNFSGSNFGVKKQYRRTRADSNCNFYNELYLYIPDKVIEDYELIDTGDKEIYFMLYTRRNPLKAQYLIYEDAPSVRVSNYNKNKPLNVVVHGWKSSGTEEIATKVTESFLAVRDCNVIVVDWKSLADNWVYPSVVEEVPQVGQHLGDFLDWLLNTIGGNWDRVHLVGHSLGAHVVGNAGRRVGGRAARLTGLDPAGPMWYNNPNSLRKTDAQYVEAIHTDGNFLGIWIPVGHADFYPNGGVAPQPGCPWWYFEVVRCLERNICSHSRSYLLFAASIKHDRFPGKLCANIKEAEHMQCHGRVLNMGNSNISKRGYGSNKLVIPCTTSCAK